MDAEEKRKAIRESRELLARRHDKPSQEPDAPPEPEVPMPPIETARDRWRREVDEADAARKAAKLALRYQEQREREQHRAAARNVITRDELDARLEAERRFSSGVLTQVLANLFERLNRLEATSRPATGDTAKIIDLPNPLRRVN